MTAAVPRNYWSILPALAMGAVAASAGVLIADLPARRIAALMAAVGVALMAIGVGRVKQILLLCWVACLTYNRNYFLDGLVGDHSSYGLFWTPADVFLAALLGMWAYEAIVWKRVQAPVGARVWPWFVPFVVACLFSMFGAIHKEYVVFELARVARIGLILAYLRWNLRREDWWVCVLGFTAAIGVQGLIGAVYVATGKIIGLAGALGTSELAGLNLLGNDSTDSGFRRASGTMGHSNTLAVYVLMTGPLFLALACTRLPKLVRLACALTGIAGLLTIGITLSRTSWVISFAQLILLGTALVWFRYIEVKHLLGFGAIGVLAIGAAAMPFIEKIATRLKGDFQESIDFRVKHNRLAIDIWSDSPIVGVGLNNYSGMVSQLDDPELRIFAIAADYVRKSMDIRITAWVHNIYLLMLAELGLIGLGAYLVFAVGGAVFAVRAIARTTGSFRAACIGIAIGMIGMHLHGLQESAFWIDPITYTFPLLMGMANVAPDLALRGDV